MRETNAAREIYSTSGEDFMNERVALTIMVILFVVILLFLGAIGYLVATDSHEFNNAPTSSKILQ